MELLFEETCGRSEVEGMYVTSLPWFRVLALSTEGGLRVGGGVGLEFIHENRIEIKLNIDSQYITLMLFSCISSSNSKEPRRKTLYLNRGT